MKKTLYSFFAVLAALGIGQLRTKHTIDYEKLSF